MALGSVRDGFRAFGFGVGGLRISRFKGFGFLRSGFGGLGFRDLSFPAARVLDAKEFPGWLRESWMQKGWAQLKGVGFRVSGFSFWIWGF